MANNVIQLTFQAMHLFLIYCFDEKYFQTIIKIHRVNFCISFIVFFILEFHSLFFFHSCQFPRCLRGLAWFFISSICDILRNCNRILIDTVIDTYDMYSECPKFGLVRILDKWVEFGFCTSKTSKIQTKLDTFYDFLLVPFVGNPD